MSDMKCPEQMGYIKLDSDSLAKFIKIHPQYNKNGMLNPSSCSVRVKAELDRTRKALDVAKEGLKSAHDYYEYCIQRDKDCDSDDINWDCTAMNMDNDISEALEQITALEQKDVK